MEPRVARRGTQVAARRVNPMMQTPTGSHAVPVGSPWSGPATHGPGATGEAPVAPFTTWHVQHSEPGLGFYWYLRPGTLVCQTVVAHATVEVIDRHNDVVDAILAARGDEIRASGGLFMVFDWRSVKTYDQGARARQRERMKARGDTYARRTVIALQPANKLLRMAVEAANLFATLLFRSGIEIATSPDAIVAETRLTPPPRNEPFPGLSGVP
jgi:hypothetical protein